MAVRITVEVDDAAVRRELARLQRAIPKRIRHRPLLAGARVVARAAKKTALFTDKTGTLRKSIRGVRDKNGRVYARANAPHAHLVEFGHSGNAGRPFMKTAAVSRQDQVFAAVGRAAERIIKSGAR